MQPGTPSHMQSVPSSDHPAINPRSVSLYGSKVSSFGSFLSSFFLYFFFFRVNTRISFHRKKAEMYQAYQCAKADLHNEEYCSWAQEPGMDCDGVGPYNKDFLNKLTQFECNLEPVIPQR